MQEHDNILKILADNQPLLEAVRSKVLEQFSVDLLSWQQPNEILGQQVRARLEGISKVEEAFKQIARLKSVQEKKAVSNPAR